MKTTTITITRIRGQTFEIRKLETPHAVNKAAIVQHKTWGVEVKRGERTETAGFVGVTITTPRYDTDKSTW